MIIRPKSWSVDGATVTADPFDAEGPSVALEGEGLDRTLTPNEARRLGNKLITAADLLSPREYAELPG